MNKSKLLIVIFIISSIFLIPAVLAAEDPYEDIAEFLGPYFTPILIKGIFVFLLLFSVFYLLLGRVLSTSKWGGSNEKKEREVISILLAAIATYYTYTSPAGQALWDMFFGFGLIPISIFLVFLFLASLVHRGRAMHLEAKVPATERKADYYNAKSISNVNYWI